MGICISYQGSLSDPSRLDEAIAEIRQFCERAGWPCDDCSEYYSGVVLCTQAQADQDPGTKDPDPEPWPELTEEEKKRGGSLSFQARVSRLHPPPLIEETVRGVIVQPPDTESLRLVFDHTGRLVHYREIPAHFIINAMPDTAHYAAFGHFCKTSCAPASHAAICVLLQALKRKLMENLQVTDGTGFWETWDLDRLNREHAIMAAFFGAIEKSAESGTLFALLGIDVPEGTKITRLDSLLERPAVKKKPRPPVIN